MKKAINTLLILLGVSININALELIGKIKVKGSSPHTYLVIEDNTTHKNYTISNAKDFNLTNRQNETLKIEAKVIKKAIGPGFPTVIEVVEVKDK
jgi:hypothetical protein